jgi:AhpC/TSA family
LAATRQKSLFHISKAIRWMPVEPNSQLPSCRRVPWSVRFNADRGLGLAGAVEVPMPLRAGDSRKTCLIVLAALLLLVSGTGRKAAAADQRLLPLKVHVGEKAPDFQLMAGNGKAVRLSQYKGHNVLIDFYRGYW